ncbi:MAG: oxidoreductase [Conexibacter sp.]|nr:oxidoreductase [Conexibacter sp.]
MPPIITNPAYDFGGQVALVTGAGSGMGLVTATAFAEAGAAVVLADIDEHALQAATEALTGAGRDVLGVPCDVSDEAQAAAAVQQAVARFGRLDMAFNNAGIQVPPSDAADETAENFDRVNAINLRGVWTAMKHELGQMREQGSGAIVNCSSLGGLVGLPSRAAYHASKHGVIGLTKRRATPFLARRHAAPTTRVSSRMGAALAGDVPETPKDPRMRAFRSHAPKRTRTSTGQLPHKALNLAERREDRGSTRDSA